jgi:hypothetical protein
LDIDGGRRTHSGELRSELVVQVVERVGQRFRIWLTAEEPLVAICRAIVADKLGMAVNVPAELIQQ